MISLVLTLLSSGALVAAQSAPASINAAPETQVLAGLESYQSSLLANPTYSSAVQVLATAIPTGELASIEQNPTAYIQSIAAATSPPAWFTALPSQYQSFFESVGSAQESLISQAGGANGLNGNPTTTMSGGQTVTNSGTSGGPSPTASKAGAAERLGAKGVVAVGAGVVGVVAAVL